jgi:2'-5' RNA ligase
MHRLFIALRPPPALRHRCLEAMEGGPSGWAWQDDEQLHLTLRFIGEVERPAAEDVAAALESMAARRLSIALAGVGWFDRGPRGALFARVAPREPLAALHAKIDRLLVSAGLEAEGRAFFPHITLARRRRTAEDPALWLEQQAGLASDPVPVSHVTLYESHLGPHGSVYEPILRVALRD